MNAFESNTQTQSAFCSEHGLSISSFQYQLRRQRSNNADTDTGPSSEPGLPEITSTSDRKNLSITPEVNPPSRLLHVELSLESRDFTVGCRPDQFAELIEQFATFHDQRETRR